MPSDDELHDATDATTDATVLDFPVAPSDDALDDGEFDDELEDGEGAQAGDNTTRRPAIRRFQASATGSALAAMMSGLGSVLEPSKKEQAAIIVDYEAPGEPFTEPIVMRLDPDDPRDSIVLVRRHLLAHHDDHDDHDDAAGS